MATILQVNFTWDLSPAERDEHSTLDGAREIAEFPGLKWTIWINDAEKKTAGGIYLFEDRERAQAWAEVLRPNLEALPNTSGISIRHFDIREDASEITRAPIGELAGTSGS